MNHIFLYIMWMTGCMRIAYLGNTCHQDSLTEEDKPEQTLSKVKLNIGWETLSPAIHVLVTLRRTICLRTGAHHVQGNVCYHKAKAGPEFSFSQIPEQRLK